MLLTMLLFTVTLLVFDVQWHKTLVQPMTAVFAGSVIVGEGLELLFIKAMCIIDYIYISYIYCLLSCFYHACDVYWCSLLVVAVFVGFYYGMHWRILLIDGCETCYTCGFIGPSLNVLVFAVSQAIQFNVMTNLLLCMVTIWTSFLYMPV